jgi:hypothetical protein
MGGIGPTGATGATGSALTAAMFWPIPGATLELLASLAQEGVIPATNSPFITTWKDTSGNDNDGSLQNMAGSTGSGWAGSGTIIDPYKLVFDGLNDFISVASIPVFGVGSFTLEALVNLDYGSAYVPIFSPTYEPWGTTPGYALYVGSNGAIVFECSNGASSNFNPNWFSDFGNIKGAWHLIDVVYDGAHVTAYCDGVKGTPKTYSLGTGTPTGALHIGSFWAGYMPGSIAISRIYPIALSAAQIMHNYLSGFATLPTKML